MPDPTRMAQLEAAWNFVLNASQDEKNELFKHHIDNLERYKQNLESEENRFAPHWLDAHRSMDEIEDFFRMVTGYHCGWVSEKFSEHCNRRTGRPRKYIPDTREVNCFFITQMVLRGSSETQAMKLLMRLRGDAAMSQGHLRELRETYRDYKTIGRLDDDFSILENALPVSELLEFDVSNLQGNEKASEKAVNAFRAFFQELIDVMKANHAIVAKNDRSYPDIYGPVVAWLNADYNDPLDYFFAHESHSTVPFERRRRCLNDYLNSVGYFLEHSS